MLMDLGLLSSILSDNSLGFRALRELMEAPKVFSCTINDMMPLDGEKMKCKDSTTAPPKNVTQRAFSARFAHRNNSQVVNYINLSRVLKI